MTKPTAAAAAAAAAAAPAPAATAAMTKPTATAAAAAAAAAAAPAQDRPDVVASETDSAPKKKTKPPLAHLTGSSFYGHPAPGALADGPDGGGEAFDEQEVGRALGRVSWVLLPSLFLAMVFNQLDRSSVSFAALQMNADLSIKAEAYGLAAGLFNLGFGLFHLPSAYAAVRFGAGRWYSIIAVAWGGVAMCGALVRSATGLYVQRFLLGVAEGGAVPTAMHLIAQFYPRERLSRPIAVSSLGTTVSTIFAAPLAAGLLAMDGVAGLRGWKWLFIIEGLPAVALGVAMFFALPQTPLDAWMLTQDDRDLLARRVHGSVERLERAQREHMTPRHALVLAVDAMRRPLLWLLTGAGFLWVCAVAGLQLWLPLLIKNILSGTALKGSQTAASGNAEARRAALLTAIPFAAASVAMLLWAWLSDRTREKSLHVAAPCLTAGALLLAFTPVVATSAQGAFAIVSIVFTLAYAAVPILYSRLTDALDLEHAAIGLAVANALASALGAFVGVTVVGVMVGRLGGFGAATLLQGALMLCAGALVLGLGVWEQVHKRRAARRAKAEAAAMAVPASPPKPAAETA